MFQYVTNINPGDIIAGLAPDDQVEVHDLKPFGSRTLVVAVGVTPGRRYRRTLSDAEPGQFAQRSGLFVTSVDVIARNDRCLNAAKDTQRDTVVVDKVHRLSACESLESLARRTDHLLFLSATPHRGRCDTFRWPLMLLDVDLFQKLGD